MATVALPPGEIYRQPVCESSQHTAWPLSNIQKSQTPYLVGSLQPKVIKEVGAWCKGVTQEKEPQSALENQEMFPRGGAPGPERKSKVCQMEITNGFSNPGYSGQRKT